MDLEKKLEKITSRTLPLYILIVLLIIFANPTGSSCFLGFIFVLMGEALRFWAAGHIRKNDELTTSGPYAYMQSPLYLGSFIVGTGLCIMARNPIIWVIICVVFFFSYIPRKKEKEWGRLENLFGEEFIKYKNKVPYFIPGLNPYPEGSKHPWSFASVIENTEHQTAIAIFLIALFIFIRLL
ncbi:MAG: isoprenylcysteine carboxylmethyltransferase family protein [Deltaproteobacteria bacterium]|nr:isoprenylcysteine carboxylmethyltransferase family protein [Deltaproteobacteria bacterium]